MVDHGPKSPGCFEQPAQLPKAHHLRWQSSSLLHRPPEGGFHALRWHQVDLVRGTIDFRRPGEAETKKRRGQVSIHRKLLGHLRRAKARQNAGDLDFVIQWEGGT